MATCLAFDVAGSSPASAAIGKTVLSSLSSRGTILTRYPEMGIAEASLESRFAKNGITRFRESEPSPLFSPVLSLLTLRLRGRPRRSCHPSTTTIYTTASPFRPAFYRRNILNRSRKGTFPNGLRKELVKISSSLSTSSYPARYF